MDSDGKLGKFYGAKTTPHVFIFDKSGILAYQGAIDDSPDGEKEQPINYIAATVDALLAGKPPEISSTKSYGCSVKYKD